MYKLYLFIINYLVGFAVYNSFIFLFKREFHPVEAFLLPLVVVSLMFIGGEIGSNNKKSSDNKKR